jgi:UDP-glucose 4-epimerase
MNILVCGGAGYIGAHMCKTLAEAGHEVTVFDNLSTGHAAAVRWGRLVGGDLLRRDEIEHAFRSYGFDAVMHFSARSLVGESMTRPDLYYQNNVAGTANLLDTMVEFGVKTFIFSSTAAVYGMPQYTPIDEQHPKVPINPYGRTKLTVEAMLSDYGAAFDLRSVTLRYFNAAGAEPGAGIGEKHDPETHLIPNVLRSVLNPSANPLKVFGADYDTPDGTCVRDYIHVTDLCDAHLRALDYLQKGGNSEIFNLGNGKGFSVLEVIYTAKAVTGRNVPYKVVDRRPGDPAVLVASADKARKVLGWQPRYTGLSEVIETAWQWHRSEG